MYIMHFSCSFEIGELKFVDERVERAQERRKGKEYVVV
jgi:hypothetical protein